MGNVGMDKGCALEIVVLEANAFQLSIVEVRPLEEPSHLGAPSRAGVWLCRQQENHLGFLAREVHLRRFWWCGRRRCCSKAEHEGCSDCTEADCSSTHHLTSLNSLLTEHTSSTTSLGRQ